MDIKMRFIHKWSYSSAKYLTKVLNQNHAQRRVYNFGFLVVYGALVKGVLLFGTSLLLGTFIPTLIITVTFAALRTRAGGYHMDSYGKCILTSLAMFLIAGLISKYIPHDFVGMLILPIFISSIFWASIYAPRDNPNRPITEDWEIKKFHRQSIIYASLFCVISIALLFGDHADYSLAVAFGVGMEMFSITPAGFRFFDWVAGEK
jgi:accessory gene regulator B